MPRPVVSAARRQYWEDKLKRFGLTEDAGRKEWLSYGHVFETTDVSTEGRVIKKIGESLELDEWPLSMY